ncbi:MAG: hypothetical protein ABI678_04625 [Kofleriaceae bacterium]
MTISAVSSVAAGPPAQGRSSSLEDQKSKLETQIVECKTCKTTPPKEKATQLAQLEARKAQVDLKLAELAQQRQTPPAIREGSTIHVIA